MSKKNYNDGLLYTLLKKITLKKSSFDNYYMYQMMIKILKSDELIKVSNIN
jgi:hypothetical protein